MTDAERSPDPYVMYLIVKTSLKMNAGKTAAQCGHAVQMLMQEVLPDHHESLGRERAARFIATREWLREDYPSYAKIVLGASDDEFMKVQLEVDCFVVVDRGFTSVAAGTETVLGLWPCRKSEAPESVKGLKLLR